MSVKTFIKKFCTMVILVFFLFIILVVGSIIGPELNKAKREVAQEDPSGLASKTLDAIESVPDPKSDAEQASGGILYWLLEKHPKIFLWLVIIVALALIFAGVHAREIRDFIKGDL